MVAKIYGNRIINCGTGISYPKDANAEIYSNDIRDCGTAIESRDPIELLVKIGLKKETPKDKVLTILEYIRNSNNDQNLIKDEIKKIGLLKYLSGTADLTTIVSTLCSLSQQPIFDKVISLFK